MSEASKIYIGPVAMFQCTRTRIGGNLKVLIKVSVVEAAKKFKFVFSRHSAMLGSGLVHELSGGD